MAKRKVSSSIKIAEKAPKNCDAISTLYALYKELSAIILETL